MNTYSYLTKQVGCESAGDGKPVHSDRDQPRRHVPQRLQ